MKTIRSSAVIIVFVAAFAFAATAQAPTKIVFINTQAFYVVNGGVTTIIDGYKKLETEMKPDAAKYEAKVSQYNTLTKSYSDLLENGGKGVPIDEADAEKKRSELQGLQTEIKRMQEDLKVKQEKREAEIMRPINAAIGASMDAFAKQKGYTAIFDIAGLISSGQILWADPTSDVTEEFIKYYNARPKGTASNQ